MSITVTPTILARGKIIGGLREIHASLALSGTYDATAKIALTPAQFGLGTLDDISFMDACASGFVPQYDRTNTRFSLYRSEPAGTAANESTHTHAVALDSGASAAGSSHNHAFTGTAPVTSLDLATPAFAGTGLTAAGQVMTTTDNQTMTLNQCAGMWLIPATQATPPMLILSNTAVAGAPAVLTVQGAAATDAGAYKIVKGLAPVGANTAEATHTHGAGTLADAASGAGAAHTHAITGTGAALNEVDNGVNVGSLTLRVVAYGV
jgi:hypothetical protein